MAKKTKENLPKEPRRQKFGAEIPNRPTKPKQKLDSSKKNKK